MRVSIQLLLLTCIAAAAFSGGAYSSGFEVKLAANNQLKNLTRGLVAITSDDALDTSLFRKRLTTLNNRVIPTYESILDSRMSVKTFLASYGIDYEEEIPIEPQSLTTMQKVNTSRHSEQRD